MHDRILHTLNKYKNSKLISRLDSFLASVAPAFLPMIGLQEEHLQRVIDEVLQQASIQRLLVNDEEHVASEDLEDLLVHNSLFHGLARPQPNHALHSVVLDAGRELIHHCNLRLFLLTEPKHQVLSLLDELLVGKEPQEKLLKVVQEFLVREQTQ